MKSKHLQEYGDFEKNYHLLRSIPPDIQLGRKARMDEELEVTQPLNTARDERPSGDMEFYPQSSASISASTFLRLPRPGTSNSSPFVSGHALGTITKRVHDNRPGSIDRPSQTIPGTQQEHSYHQNSRTGLHASLYQNPSLARGSMILYRIAPVAFSSPTTIVSTKPMTTPTEPPTLLSHPMHRDNHSTLNTSNLNSDTLANPDSEPRFCSHLLSQYAYVDSRSSLQSSSMSERSNSMMSMSVSLGTDSKYPVYPTAYTQTYLQMDMAKRASSSSSSSASSESVLPPGLGLSHSGTQVQAQGRRQKSQDPLTSNETTINSSMATGGLIAYVYDPDEDDPDDDDEDDEDWAKDPLMMRIHNSNDNSGFASDISLHSVDSGVDLGSADTCNAPRQLVNAYGGLGSGRKRVEMIIEPRPPLTLSLRAISNIAALVVVFGGLIGAQCTKDKSVPTHQAALNGHVLPMLRLLTICLHIRYDFKLILIQNPFANTSEPETGIGLEIVARKVTVQTALERYTYPLWDVCTFMVAVSASHLLTRTSKSCSVNFEGSGINATAPG
ncbi:hypothetical protein K435DRAFT_793293 [Dendrothele bispora CBS 962.96]|uniref:Uncharacterized protein n=1 Tax=Dendrothele bispora (strain CBS 962.96) TaxID=1314807 RepID=A0A4S8MFS6_DENBC|nr:hypothetical protein K435DRAFT_793293 [Dendrothele bispora CBS 962.96]